MTEAPNRDEQLSLLQEAEQFQRIVAGVTDYALFLLDPQGVVLTWNAGAEAIKGYRSDEIVGQHFSRFYPQEAIARGWPQYELEVAARVGRFEDEGWRLRKDGSLFWANVVITALRGPNGSVRGYAKITRDLTERKRQEESLRQSEERFRLIVESVRDYAIFMLDPEGRVATWNAGAQQIKQYAAEEIVGQHFSRFYPEEAVARGWPEHELKVARREGRFEDEGWRVRKDGSLFWANVVITALYDEDGEVRGYAKVTRDLTERKQAEERLRESNAELERRVQARTAQLNDSNAALRESHRKKDEFLATLAHELRNPLAPLRAGIDLLKYSQNDPQAIEETRAIMEQQLAHMVRLIDDLLEISRLTQGKLRLRKEATDLTALVRSLVHSFRATIEEAGQTLVAQLPDEPIEIVADPLRISQIVSNLLSNASKYSEPGDRIFVTLSRQDDEAIVTVRDEGIGIEPVHLPRLFEMFSQVESAIERSRGGLGIGLALVRGLAELHDGNVEAHSAGPGQGSEFIVRLPIENSARRSRLRVRSGEAAESPSRCRILLVDDNRDAVRLLARALEALGHDVSAAYDGVEAVHAAESLRPDLILLDIGMPRMDGYEAARRIRASSGGRDPYLVAVTGWGQEHDKRRALEAGFDRHETKPISVETIRTLIEQVRAC